MNLIDLNLDLENKTQDELKAKLREIRANRKMKIGRKKSTATRKVKVPVAKKETVVLDEQLLEDFANDF